MVRFLVPAACLALLCAAADDPLPAKFAWEAGQALIGPENRDGDTYHSIKDPTVVRHGGRWHLFCTIRGKQRSHQIEYLSFADWSQTANAKRTTLKLTEGYFCAPQVFYFRPHRKWYLVYQVIDKSRTPALQPAYSTSSEIDDPASWTPPRLLFSEAPRGIKSWIDFWVICDSERAHLFFTGMDGKMWRAGTKLADFPGGWEAPRVVLVDDIFEASHTYRLKGSRRYLTVVEAQGPGGRRYYKAYTADTLEGAWKPLAATLENAFAATSGVRFPGEPWTDSFSHGELLRDGRDETLTIDPARLEFLFQGVSDGDRQGKVYGEIPWKLGLLRLAPRAGAR